jgi:hypothetical protein
MQQHSPIIFQLLGGKLAIKTDTKITTDAKLLEKMDELRSLKKDYRDVHSVKEDLFEVCNRLKDREPELCEHLWQVCLLVHERCEAIYSLILDLKKDVDRRGCSDILGITAEEVNHLSDEGKLGHVELTDTKKAYTMDLVAEFVEGETYRRSWRWDEIKTECESFG